MLKDSKGTAETKEPGETEETKEPKETEELNDVNCLIKSVSSYYTGYWGICWQIEQVRRTLEMRRT